MYMFLLKKFFYFFYLLELLELDLFLSQLDDFIAGVKAFSVLVFLQIWKYKIFSALNSKNWKVSDGFFCMYIASVEVTVV